MATQTLAILREFSDLGFEGIRAKAEEVVHEYRMIAENMDEVVTVDVDFASVIQDVTTRFSGDINLFSALSTNKNTNL